jgi:hypothetical protein
MEEEDEDPFAPLQSEKQILARKFDILQTDLLCDRRKGRKVAPFEFITTLLETAFKSLPKYMYVCIEGEVMGRRFNMEDYTWGNAIVNELPSRNLEAVRGLSDGRLVAICSTCWFVWVNPETEQLMQSHYFGQEDEERRAALGDRTNMHELKYRHDDRPEIFAVVHLHDDVYACFDNIFFRTYIEVDFATGNIVAYEEADDDTYDARVDANEAYIEFGNVSSTYYDIGGGKCLLASNTHDPNGGSETKFIVIDVRSKTFKEIPSPYERFVEVEGDSYVGMKDGRIFGMMGMFRHTGGAGNDWDPTAHGFIFDPTTNRWSVIPDAPRKIEKCYTALLPRGDIMVVSFDQVDDCMIYHTAFDRWTAGKMPMHLTGEELWLVVAQ